MAKHQKLIEVARYYDYGEAHIARGILESNDIRCELFDESANAALWYYGIAMKGTRLMVSEQSASEAKEILSQIKATPHTTKQLLPDTNRKWILFILVFAPYPVCCAIFLINWIING